MFSMSGMSGNVSNFENLYEMSGKFQEISEVLSEIRLDTLDMLFAIFCDGGWWKNLSTCFKYFNCLNVNMRKM